MPKAVAEENEKRQKTPGGRELCPKPLLKKTRRDRKLQGMGNMPKAATGKRGTDRKLRKPEKNKASKETTSWLQKKRYNSRPNRLTIAVVLLCLLYPAASLLPPTP